MKSNLTKKDIEIMTNSVAVEYLEKYAVAPSPSRDYYGIKVIQDQVILYTWRISHGPHTNPIVRVSRFCDFNNDKTMHDEIQRVFGEPIFRHVHKIAEGNERTLLTLPKHLIKKLTTYLTFGDVLKLSTISNISKELEYPRSLKFLAEDFSAQNFWKSPFAGPKSSCILHASTDSCISICIGWPQFEHVEIFSGDYVWELLYRRHKMGLVYRDERAQGSSHGWKRLFEDREMHKPARCRKIEKISSEHRAPHPRSTAKLTNRPSSAVTPLKNQKLTPSTAKLAGTGAPSLKSTGSKYNYNLSGRPDTANKIRPDAVETKGRKLLGSKKFAGDEDLSDKMSTLETIPLQKVEARRPEFKSNSVVGTRENYMTKGRTMPKNSNEKTTSAKSSITVSGNIGAGKILDKKPKRWLKNFAVNGEISNSSSPRKVKSRSVANTVGQKTLAGRAKKTEDPKIGGKLETYEAENALEPVENRKISSVNDFGLDELIGSSITVKGLNSKNLLASEYQRDRDCQLKSNTEKRSREQKFSKPDIIPTGAERSRSTIYERFSTPTKPEVEHSQEVSAKKFSDIKSYLKRNGKNDRGNETKSGDINMKVDSKSTRKKKTPDKVATKFKSRTLPTTASCESLDSKLKLIKSSQRLEPKKRSSLKK